VFLIETLLAPGAPPPLIWHFWTEMPSDGPDRRLVMTSAALVQAASDAEFTIARALFVEYADQLGVDLCFQGFAAELDTLAQMYGPPGGCLILAQQAGEYVGCIGVRRLSAEVCEMKRLYVRTTVRGGGLGRRLAQAAIDAAQEIGYQRMVLDTLASMAAARVLYATLGFRPIAAYYKNPMPGVMYMALELGSR
jgi:putative acetyltransferase